VRDKPVTVLLWSVVGCARVSRFQPDEERFGVLLPLYLWTAFYSCS
jgi:hypothetical protein